MSVIRRALLSVSDKTGLVAFAQKLAAMEVELISTGGTAKALSDAGLEIKNVSDVTHFPEMLEGRVKTLHPAVHGGILADRSKPEHMATIQEHGITPIDLVVVNLYPFAATVARPDVTLEEAIENIDIGGPSMVRSAAKNHHSVTVIVSPEDYETVVAEMEANQGSTSPETRNRLAAKAFGHTAGYDAAISRYLQAQYGDPAQKDLPEDLTLSYRKIQSLRYGENPHQRAAFYRDVTADIPGVATAKQIHGKELSFNNIYDLNAAYALVQEFVGEGGAAVAIIKHTNPCGVAVASTPAEAFKRARASDPLSAFGGIVAMTQAIDAATAEAITGKNTFFEAIIAPGYSPEALEILTAKKSWSADLRLLEAKNLTALVSTLALKQVLGGILAQTADQKQVHAADLTLVTRRETSEAELADLLFAWKVVKHVKSNAIVVAKDQQIIGVGAGQMNRVQSVRLALEQAGVKAEGAVLASDGLFPFADGPETAGKAGISAIIQPGGSKKDADSIAMADVYNMAMVFTGVRHFQH